MIKKFRPVILLGAILVSACTPKSGIEISHAWTRSAAQGENGAIYFTITNHEAIEDALIGVSADFAKVAELHESKMVDDVMEMQMQELVPLPTGATVELAPGGLHIMLIELTRDLVIGETVEVTLHFNNHADIPLTVTVQAGPDHSDMDD